MGLLWGLASRLFPFPFVSIGPCTEGSPNGRGPHIGNRGAVTWRSMFFKLFAQHKTRHRGIFKVGWTLPLRPPLITSCGCETYSFRYFSPHKSGGEVCLIADKQGVWAT